jgi:putative PIN family toxin of toxin-antitoxin system
MADRRVVIDTNVYLSASISRTGAPARALRLAYSSFKPVFSEATIIELVERLNGKKMARWIEPAERVALMAFVLRQGTLVDPVPMVRLLSDPDDDIFASLDLAADADAIVTGDKKFLASRRVGRVPVLSPREFLNRFEVP